jgi:uncharacterized small protein (DUF1192 family)
MAIFDKISNFAKNAADNTKDMLEVSKLNGKISQERNKIEQHKKELGEYVWKQHEAGVGFDEEAETILNGIAECNEAIAKLEAEIAAIKAPKPEPAPAAEPAAEPEPEAPKAVCPSCGSEYTPPQKFCPQCGFNLVQPAERFCPECGSKVPEGRKFCGECGRKLD